MQKIKRTLFTMKALLFASIMAATALLSGGATTYANTTTMQQQSPRYMQSIQITSLNDVHQQTFILTEPTQAIVVAISDTMIEFNVDLYRNLPDGSSVRLERFAARRINGGQTNQAHRFLNGGVPFQPGSYRIVLTPTSLGGHAWALFSINPTNSLVTNFAFDAAFQRVDQQGRSRTIQSHFVTGSGALWDAHLSSLQLMQSRMTGEIYLVRINTVSRNWRTRADAEASIQRSINTFGFQRFGANPTNPAIRHTINH
jgi:hypothetical protein